MLSVNKNGKVCRVNGDRSDLVLFWSLYQSRLWPDWSTDLPGHMQEEAIGVLKRIRSGEGLAVWIGSDFVACAEHAIEVCQKCGIDVLVTSQHPCAELQEAA